MYRITAISAILLVLCASVATADEPKWYALMNCSGYFAKAKTTEITAGLDGIQAECQKHRATATKWRVKIREYKSGLFPKDIGKDSRYLAFSFKVTSPHTLSELLAIHAKMLALRGLMKKHFSTRFSLYAPGG